MGLYSGGLIIGRIFASEIWGLFFWGGGGGEGGGGGVLIIGMIFASEIWGLFFGGGGEKVECLLSEFYGMLLPYRMAIPCYTVGAGVPP